MENDGFGGGDGIDAIGVVIDGEGKGERAEGEFVSGGEEERVQRGVKLLGYSEAEGYRKGRDGVALELFHGKDLILRKSVCIS